MYIFKPLAQEHFKTLFQWLQLPHIQAWWDSETDFTIFSQRYNNMIANSLVFPHIVFKNKIPIGYINYWFVQEDNDFIKNFPADTVGIDQFIGVPELIGKGIGPEFIQQFADTLLSNPEINLVIIDVNPQNISAIRAYEKAGFQKSILMTTAEGKVQILEKRN